MGRNQVHTTTYEQVTTPINRVLHIAELCESTLQYLSFRDLIRLQLVCRDLNAAIRDSPALQAKLFLKPSNDNNPGEWVADYQNRLFVGQAAQPYLDKIKKGSHNFNVVKPVICNPILTSPRHNDICNSRSPRRAVAVSINDHVDRPYHLHEHFDPRNDRIRRPEAYYSCRRMFLTQPPVTVVELAPVGRCEHSSRQNAYLRPGWCDQCAGNKVIAIPNGVTLGQLIDETSSRGSQGKHVEPDKIRFPGVFVITKEVEDWVYDRAQAAGHQVVPVHAHMVRLSQAHAQRERFELEPNFS